ncbi:O-linked N-acetylglucosamine transferase, SPINDLY family protein [Microcoleus sp. FACHB-1515]|uniref:O-linked N-acetylglucosamine transferase, SPINDLY family protein n=1 Tax=Cyanophyceae TaxID=3028117 RepID=UPI0016827199|nr:O-linked N-acetylglucosamine transferase, SPINDLY family protein [Microcoleus sp. FACHB-1515]MBD2088945.1 O-linked N-acetylglucosamine transferase, SPINDLY family protein [Microcoleus sp. FACHB-1515]
MSIDCLQEIDRAIGNDAFDEARQLCEAAIHQTDSKTPFWYLGLIALLQEQEADAQAIWLVGMAEGEADDLACWTIELAEILQREIQRRSIDSAKLLRQYFRELVPTDLDNLLHLLQLTSDPLAAAEYVDSAIELLQTEVPIDLDLLQTTLRDLISAQPEVGIALAEVCASVLSPDWTNLLLPQAIELTTQHDFERADRYLRLGLQLDPQHVPTIAYATRNAIAQERYRDGVELAQLYRQLAPNFDHQLAANTLLLKGLLCLGSAWSAAESAQAQQIALLKADLTAIAPSTNAAIVCSPLYYAPYLADDPSTRRSLQNQAAARYQSSLEPLPPAGITRKSKRRIGYLSRCLRQHSVGWLCRWLFAHYDRDQFEAYVYFLQPPPLEAFSERWFARAATQFRLLTGDARSIATQIRADDIDILIDLDSITVPLTCEVMALKPAPIQATWLGTDASGLPAIDYFIADPYVLPETAQIDYRECIWRLPRTYIAVDGFEVGVPTLRRDQLGISSEAIVFLTSQSAFKRHPDTVRAQMQILRAVPNSHLLVKGLGDADGLRQCFEEIALSEGVAIDRLRFLPLVSDEATHRANLAIADVVLDTFPYNGATTTLETLWMGIPLVTQVGEQFAARNSYTMLKNVGVSAGIAWSAEDYVEWGIRLGTDAALRQHVSWQLRQSRQTAPLWNARQFTRDLEQAFSAWMG